MKLLRDALAMVAVLLLLGGYIASQVVAFQGAEATFNYAQKVDMPAIRYLALALLVAAIVLAFVPERGEEA